jgi:hypothetical protein
VLLNSDLGRLAPINGVEPLNSDLGRLAPINGVEPRLAPINGVEPQNFTVGSNFGGDKGTRTPDPFHAMEVLSQLSYIPT